MGGQKDGGHSGEHPTGAMDGWETWWDTLEGTRRDGVHTGDTPWGTQRDGVHHGGHPMGWDVGVEQAKGDTLWGWLGHGGHTSWLYP